MNYKITITGVFTLLLTSSTVFAADSHTQYSCDTVDAIAQQNNKAAQLRFIHQTLPAYVSQSKEWKQDIGHKAQWMNNHYSQRSGLFMFNILNTICKNKPSDYNPAKDPIEDMYFYAVDTAFNALQPK